MYQSPTFSFKKLKLSSKRRGSLSNLATNDNYPFLSTNISSYNILDRKKFIIASAPTTSQTRGKPSESTFRPQNKFIIARNFIGCLISPKARFMGSVSKVAGKVSLKFIKYNLKLKLTIRFGDETIDLSKIIFCIYHCLNQLGLRSLKNII